MTKDNCVQGTKNEQRIITLERDMGRISRWITTLVLASFTTLCTAIIALVVTLIERSGT